jgi:RNA polymerase sigma factor (sigma-70 family)
VGCGLSIDGLEAVYRRGYRRFLRLALAVTGDRETAREVVQDAFAAALRSRFDFRGDGSPEAWVWRIVVNHARSAVRGGDRVLDEPNELAAANREVSDWAELRVAVAALPERQRLVVFLRHYADLDYQGIAETLQIERGTVAATLHAAHKALRQQLQEVPR